MRIPSRALCVLWMLVISACSAPEVAMPTNDSVSSGPSPRVAAIQSKFRQNPEPRQAYQVTMTVADAPGPFASVQGFVNYEAPGCVYMLDRIAGVPATASRGFPVEFTKLDDTRYSGTIYTDAMIDEDYFGNGICRWQLTGMNVQLKATGADGETNFIASLLPEALRLSQTATMYYQKQLYPRSSQMDNFQTFGRDESRMNPDTPADDFFSITLDPRKADWP